MDRKVFGYLLVTLAATRTSFAATLTVDLHGTAGYIGIQSAIDAAADGDTVLVKPGEYLIAEPVTLKGKAITVKSEAGTEATTIRMSETPADPDRASVVIFESGETGTSILEGFRITGGATGGIRCSRQSSPTLTSCTISGNSGNGMDCSFASPMLASCTVSGSSGDGVHCDNSSPTLTNCTISGNSCSGVSCASESSSSSPSLTKCTISGNSGNGVQCDNASLTLTNCTISGNSGSGVYCYSASPTLRSCTISGNSGSGVYCSESSSPMLTVCTISGNYEYQGGGVCCAGGSPILMNCTISGNWARDCGGGVYCAGGFPILTDCTISGNWASGGGGAYCAGGSPILTNCTISGNWALEGGGVCCVSNSFPTLTECIVWDNVGGSVYKDENSHPIITYSCIEGEPVWAGEGNINQDPLFCGWGERQDVWVDTSWASTGDGSPESPFSDPRQATMGYLALSSSSPCLGTGEGGSDMGSDNGSCDVPGRKTRIMHLAAGTYKAAELEIVHHVSLQGSGEERTVVEGTVVGLRTGAYLSNLTITKGTAGGILCASGESPEITDCTISGNSAYRGGGVYCAGGFPILTNCTISGNRVGGKLCGGGGVYCAGGSLTLTNCTISGNSVDDSSGQGGGVHCAGGSLTLTNCTISGNSGYQSGGVYCGGGSTILTNCIVWGNTPESACGSLSHCLTGQDPLFVRTGEWVDCPTPDGPLCIANEWSPETGEPVAWQRWVFDYHLRPGSPAIDAGTSEGAPEEDIEGAPRPMGGGFDIGAYEYTPCPSAGDTHCLGLEVQGPEAGGPGTYVAKATAQDESGNSISYTFSVRRGDDAPIVIGPQAWYTASFNLDAGTWTVSVEVDDVRWCADAAADAVCSVEVEIRPAAGLQRPGDANQDGKVDLSDAVWLLGHLFLGTKPNLPCEGGTASSPGPGDFALANVNGDERIDLSDTVSILSFLFLGAKPPALGTECVRIAGCPENARCQ